MSTDDLTGPPLPLSLAVIEDHQLVRDGLLALLDGPDHPDMVAVYAGSDPVAAAAAGPHVALLDIDLGGHAPDVAANVAVLVGAGAAVLLVSALADPAAVRAGIDAGALGFVPKRAGSDVLREAVETVARHELHLNAELAAILAASVDVPDLSPRELDALRLYSSGLKLASVARRMGVSPSTAKEYLDRVRSKYEVAGRHARTRAELTRAAERDGFLHRRP
jgi:two-component system, NarL family, nitrate/nitrite response regulator NarL